jgi:hypothetical protein
LRPHKNQLPFEDSKTKKNVCSSMHFHGIVGFEKTPKN